METRSTRSTAKSDTRLEAGHEHRREDSDRTAGDLQRRRVLCCGGFAYLGYMFAPQIGTLPAEINAVRDEIVTITLPAGLEPEASVKMDNFIMSYKTVRYESKDAKTSLTIDEMNAKMGDAPPNQDAKLRRWRSRDISVR
jgi:hypothetical protein